MLPALPDCLLKHVALPAAIACVACSLAAPATAQGPFDPFIGEWRGDGVVTTEEGERAPLRCKVEFLGEVGDRASQALRCSAPGGFITINSSMRIEAEELIGSWSNDRGKAGGLSGTIDEETIDVQLAAEEIDARMLSKRDGCRMTVTIEGSLGAITDLQVDLENGC